MIRKVLWALLGILIAVPIGVVLTFAKIGQFKAMGAAGEKMQAEMPPEKVNAYVLREDDHQPRDSAVGSVVAVQGTVVSTEADGIVRATPFKEGSAVSEGEVLLQLDTEIEEAQLREAVAAADLATTSFGRTQGLAANRTVAAQENDANRGALNQALAKVDSLKAVIAKKTVRAPFAGRLGLRRVNVGQFLTKGSPVVSLQALDPVYVDFTLPQRRLASITEGLTVEVTSDAYTSQTFSGKITAINPDVDPDTRNLRARATLTNADGHLRPGMYVGVQVVMAKSEKVVYVPSTAVVHASYGDSVYVVEPPAGGATTTVTLVARPQVVRLGARQGDFVVVTEGVKPGQSVVSTGVFKLRPNAPVAVDNTLAPAFSLNPRPGNT